MDSSCYILGNKPSGVTTHSSSPQLPGYQDWLAHTLQQNLFTCHRLDKETTGSLLFATSKQSAAELSDCFAHHTVHKKYIFITDKKPEQQQWTCSSPLSTQKSSQDVPASTTFTVLKTQGRYSVVQAEPLTGRTHQVRQHAQRSHVPLFGDTVYGGTPFPQFYLHCQSLSVPSLNIYHETPAPLVFDQLELLKHPLLCQWLTSIDTRQRLFGDITSNCYRLIHNENTPLRLDLLGGIGCAGWWDSSPPTLEHYELLDVLFKILNISQWRLMHHSGQRQQDQCLVDRIETSDWLGHENSIKLEFRKESGLSCGLFLDQRDNRKWIYENSVGKNVLNLFAYTGGFSVAAAMGKAIKTTTVDLSKKYIEWSKINFQLNKLPLENHAFYSLDAMEFLKFADKKKIAYDTIICDPPSFSRDKKGHVFQVEKHFVNLLQACLRVLAPQGTILFSTNYEKWTQDRWHRELQKALVTENLEITQKLSFQWDFETHHDRHMKAFLIVKK